MKTDSKLARHRSHATMSDSRKDERQGYVRAARRHGRVTVSRVREDEANDDAADHREYIRYLDARDYADYSGFDEDEEFRAYCEQQG